ncbi:MBL fold metallo-hydrolase [Catellatospora sp. TT07R-123]|uniref:MBL fold metallo-hydrolase n=1 Tax=Catellatospora sp. TT07R-123 TaxID=2733863 RepID=UPI001FD23F6A|nr:MBL fold metallo-hydrolase [Catellatospora sp. TT07R-123]
MTASLVFLGHSTVLLDLGGVRVLTDPVLRGRLLFLRRVVAPPAPGNYGGVDAVVLSHLHHDHCDLPSLALLGRDIPLIAPDGSGDFLRRRGFRQVVTLAAGQSHRVGAVTVTATPAVHDGRREPFGPRAAAVGYRIASPRTAVYFAGDTDLFPGMADLGPDLDLALVPVWGWGPNLGPGHLDPGRAAEAVALLRPRLAVPIHWGTLFPYGLSGLYRHRLRTPARAFADAVAARALPTRVTVLAPGRGMAWQP